MSAIVFDDHCCALGEGPLWHPDRQSLFWFDIDNQVMFEKTDGGRRVEYHFDRTVSAVGLTNGDELIVASEHNLFTFNLASGTQRVLCELEADNPLTRSNDGRADPFGGFWIGTMGFEAQANLGAIYRYYKGELQQLFSGITIPNAICFSPHRAAAFYTDSATRVIWQVGLDDEGWPAGEPLPLIDLREEDFAPDGAVCDREGRLWLAQWMASRVAVYSDRGKILETHPVPTSQATCPAFGGPDFSTLFVTTAGAHLPAELQGTQPLAGFVFKIEGVGPGQAEHRVIL